MSRNKKRQQQRKSKSSSKKHVAQTQEQNCTITQDADTTKQWIFEPIDSWFFREMRPFQVTGAELGSVFPPPARTIAGAVRGIIGERVGVDWAAYRKGDVPDLSKKMGDPRYGGEAEFGKLQLTGPYLLKDGQRLYPVPQHLLQDEEEEYYWLKPGEPLVCDLGNIKLPVVESEPDKKIKPLLNAWVDADNLRKILNGENPTKIYRAAELFVRETRIGIGLDKERVRRTTEEGLLYQTSHVRLGEGVALAVGVGGISEDLQLGDGETRHIRFGGEGRMAAVSLGSAASLPQMPVIEDQKIVLVLLTPLLVPKDGNFFMPFAGATRVQHNGADVWEVELCGVKLKILSATLGKPQREGGWNLAQNKPRALRSLVPAGSVWFCEVMEGGGDPSTLHGAKIGEETALGRGELAVGVWGPLSLSPVAELITGR
jgi:CRISPR-associated protein Cmr3